MNVCITRISDVNRALITLPGAGYGKRLVPFNMKHDVNMQTRVIT